MTRGVALDGPEGTVQLYWGSGFGGYCAEAVTIKAAEGELPACYSVDANGIQHWDQINKDLPAVAFSGLAFTKDATPCQRRRGARGPRHAGVCLALTHRHDGGQRLANLCQSPGGLQHQLSVRLEPEGRILIAAPVRD